MSKRCGEQAPIERSGDRRRTIRSAMARPTHTLAVTAADVEAAAERIAGAVERTPTAHSVTLSAITGPTST